MRFFWKLLNCSLNSELQNKINFKTVSHLLNLKINPLTWIDIIDWESKLLMNFKVIFHFEFLLKIGIEIIPDYFRSTQFIPVSCSGCLNSVRLKIAPNFKWYAKFLQITNSANSFAILQILQVLKSTADKFASFSTD